MTTTTASAATPRLNPSSGASTGQRGIDLQGWAIQTTVLPILNGPESDRAASTLHLPLPEICFGNNRLTVENTALGMKLEWDALCALREVAADAGDVKVKHAAEWAKGQDQADLTVQKPYDWTYTTLYAGAVTSTTSSVPEWESAPIDHPGIPLHLLARQDIPILFFSEVPLFEDELGDNGIAELVVRVRVNSTSFFVLSRFFLRVDGVLLRINDVRTYHTFGSKEIIRETKGRQAPYDVVKSNLPLGNRDDLKPLTDINWVAGVLEKLSLEKGRETGAVEGRLRGLRIDQEEKGNWKGEGTRLEVLRLP